MNAATVTVLPCSQARFSWRGVEHTFADVLEAQATAAAHQIPCEVRRPSDAPPLVLAESPALHR